MADKREISAQAICNCGWWCGIHGFENTTAATAAVNAELGRHTFERHPDQPAKGRTTVFVKPTAVTTQSA